MNVPLQVWSFTVADSTPRSVCVCHASCHMTHIRCPELDLLTNELNEAYRRLTEATSTEDATEAANELARVVRCFSAHRIGCVLCKVQSSAFPEMHQASFSRRAKLAASLADVL